MLKGPARDAGGGNALFDRLSSTGDSCEKTEVALDRLEDLDDEMDDLVSLRKYDGGI